MVLAIVPMYIHKKIGHYEKNILDVVSIYLYKYIFLRILRRLK